MKKLTGMFCFLSMILATFTPFVSAGSPATQTSALVGMNSGHSISELASSGFNVLSQWDDINGGQLLATPQQLQALAQNPNVAFVEEDVVLHAQGHGPLPYADGALTWGLQAVHAQEAWMAGANGTGIGVCILDTGITYNHPEFQRGGVSIIKQSKNFVPDGHPDATDGHSHGTHVAGTIAGQTNASGSTIGVAPGVDLYIARVLDDTGSGATSNLVNGLRWCKTHPAVRVSNASLGSSVGTQTLKNAYNSAYNNGRGILNVAASGNDGMDFTSYPANYDSAVAVGAITPNETLASFSNYGIKQELVGPGTSVLSSVPLGQGLRGTAMEDGASYTNRPLEFAPNGSVSGSFVECGIADVVGTCNHPPTGTWIAMIDRGAVTFQTKILNVMAQGASGAVIANNDTLHPDDAGYFTLISPDNYIPTVSVSYNSGVSIRRKRLLSGNVAIAAWDYSYFAGTSMASPHVAAVAAITFSAKPSLNAAAVRTILQNTAKDLGDVGRDISFGYGLVQADAAVAQAKVTP